MPAAPAAAPAAEAPHYASPYYPLPVAGAPAPYAPAPGQVAPVQRRIGTAAALGGTASSSRTRPSSPASWAPGPPRLRRTGSCRPPPRASSRPSRSSSSATARPGSRAATMRCCMTWCCCNSSRAGKLRVVGHASERTETIDYATHQAINDNLSLKRSERGRRRPPADGRPRQRRGHLGRRRPGADLLRIHADGRSRKPARRNLPRTAEGKPRDHA